LLGVVSASLLHRVELSRKPVALLGGLLLLIVFLLELVLRQYLLGQGIHLRLGSLLVKLLLGRQLCRLGGVAHGGIDGAVFLGFEVCILDRQLLRLKPGLFDLLRVGVEGCLLLLGKRYRCFFSLFS